MVRNRLSRVEQPSEKISAAEIDEILTDMISKGYPGGLSEGGEVAPSRASRSLSHVAMFAVGITLLCAVAMMLHQNRMSAQQLNMQSGELEELREQRDKQLKFHSDWLGSINETLESKNYQAFAIHIELLNGLMDAQVADAYKEQMLGWFVARLYGLDESAGMSLARELIDRIDQQ